MTNIETKVIDKLKTIFDPEIPVDIYNLGLIYNIAINDSNHVFITMTLTTATCPAAGYMPEEVESVVREIPEVEDVHVHVVWDPKWNKSMMSEEAKEELGYLF